MDLEFMRGKRAKQGKGAQRALQRNTAQLPG